MDSTADGLVARVARELLPRAEELTAEVEQCLRREMPDLWAHPDAMASDNVADHVVAVLSALQYGLGPGGIEVSSAELERVRRVARHGVPVSAVLRAFRLGEGIILDHLLAEMPRFTDDAALVSEAARRLVVAATGYVDRTSEQGVVAYEQERDRRLRWRLSMVNESSVRIGTTLDIARTTQELADFATEHFADLATVDLLDSALGAHGAAPDDPPASPVLHRVAQRSPAHPGPAPTAAPGPPTPSARLPAVPRPGHGPAVQAPPRRRQPAAVRGRRVRGRGRR
ncbi:hypothetical protein E4N62_08745 [Streptomyces sp. MNU76]|nr:hypothetical protein [Streptomyces sp. MNU76]MCC9705339.1 hypothetical protein [Streptomyces sp. MNU76]